MIEQRINRRLAAILAADVVGYSRLMEADEAGTLAALKRHREAVFDPAVAAHNGRIVKLIGDGVIAEFSSVVDAVNCALSVQRSSTTNFSLEKYEIAAQQLFDRIARNPGTDASRMLLASCYGHLGCAEDARAVWTELLKVNPDFSLTQRSRVLPYKNANDFQRILEGLAKAGLP